MRKYERKQTNTRVEGKERMAGGACRSTHIITPDAALHLPALMFRASGRGERVSSDGVGRDAGLCSHPHRHRLV